jgi:YD repeat-containing protein
VTAQTVDGVTTSFTYDVTNQVTADGPRTFSYDANGNRTMSGYTTGPGNQLLTDGTWTYTYDAAGNRTKKSKGASAETWTYGYDQQDRLMWVEQRSTDGGTLLARVEYAYDALGHRLTRTEYNGSLVVVKGNNILDSVRLVTVA